MWEWEELSSLETNVCALLLTGVKITYPLYSPSLVVSDNCKYVKFSLVTEVSPYLIGWARPGLHLLFGCWEFLMLKLLLLLCRPGIIYFTICCQHYLYSVHILNKTINIIKYLSGKKINYIAPLQFGNDSHSFIAAK